MTDLAAAQLRPQSFGLAMAQTTFGGPRGIWLECRTCRAADAIVGSRFDGPYSAITDAQAATIFRRHGWTGEGDAMKAARCPKCSR